MNEDTTSLQELTYWILTEAHIQKHCVANMTRTDNYKTGKTTITVTFRDLGTKKKANAWFLKNRGITYLNSFGHSFDSHFIRGTWSVLNIAQEMNVMLGGIWKCMKWHLGTEAMHGQQIGAYKDEGVQAIRSKTTNWPTVQLIFDEQPADARITIYVSDEFEGFNFNGAKEKLEIWFTQEEEYQKRNRGERANLEEASSSSYIPRPPNQLVEVESPQSHWRRIIFLWSSLEEEFPNFIMELQSNITALQNKGDRKGQGKGDWSNLKGKGKPPRGALPKATPTEPPKGKGKTQSQENPPEHPRPQPAQQTPTAWPNRTLDFRVRDEIKGKGQGQGKGKGKGQAKGKQSILSRPQDWWLPTPTSQWPMNLWQGSERQENEWQEYW